MAGPFLTLSQRSTRSPASKHPPRMLRGIEHDCDGSGSNCYIDQGSTASLRVVIPPSVEPANTLDGVSDLGLGDPMKLRDLVSGAAANAQVGHPHRGQVPVSSSRCIFHHRPCAACTILPHVHPHPIQGRALGSPQPVQSAQRPVRLRRPGPAELRGGRPNRGVNLRLSVNPTGHRRYLSRATTQR